MALHAVDVRLEDSSDKECVDLVLSISREDFEGLKQEASRKRHPDITLAFLNAAQKYFSTWSEERSERLARQLLALRPKSTSSDT